MEMRPEDGHSRDHAALALCPTVMSGTQIPRLAQIIANRERNFSLENKVFIRRHTIG